MSYPNNTRNHSEVNAAILVDYSNVRQLADELIGGSEQSNAIVLRLLEETKRYVCRQLGFRVVRMLCFDNVPPGTGSGHQATAPLLAMGAEPRFVHAASGSNAASIALTIQASELLQGTIDIDTFVLMTGDRWYVPLAHYLLRNGRNVIVAALETPAESEQVPSDLAESYFNTRKLLEKAGRLETNGMAVESSEPDDQEISERSVEMRPVEFLPIEDPIARSAMEIIEQYFGQYREVYLTPLLRKMTELLEEEDEPKTVINYLEECGAVWLEKRRGFPHNYTVLLVNPDHPDVIEIKELFREDGRERYYDEDPYEDLSRRGDMTDNYASRESSFEEAHD